MFLQDVTSGRTPKEVVLRPGKGRHLLHQAKMYVKSSQVDLIKTSSIFDSLDSLLWDTLGFNISDAIINVPALSARLFCDVSDWIWEDISDMTSWFLFCVFYKHNNYMCVRWFIHYVTMPCLFRFKPGWWTWGRREQLWRMQQVGFHDCAGWRHVASSDRPEAGFIGFWVCIQMLKQVCLMFSDC